MELYTWVNEWLPSGGDVVSEGRPWAYFSCEAEVAHFDDVVVDEEVFRFHVSMEKAMFVHAGESTGDLEDHVSICKGKYLIYFYVKRLFSSFILE